MNNLRYFFSVGIVNPATKEVILRALQQKGLSLDEFPGCIFEPDDAEFSAILGTPNVQGFAYLLIEHKEQLGNMFISKLQVFYAETTHHSPCVLVHVSRPISTSAAEGGKAVRRDREGDVVMTHELRW